MLEKRDISCSTEASMYCRHLFV